MSVLILLIKEGRAVSSKFKLTAKAFIETPGLYKSDRELGKADLSMVKTAVTNNQQHYLDLKENVKKRQP